MAYKAPGGGITILEGLEAVRRRPAMYIGGEEPHPSRRVQLLESVVDEIAHEPQAEVRILLWREDAVTIAYDGSPLPIEPFSRPIDGVAHPALYQSFMYLFAGGMLPFGTAAFGPVLNALSERLVVSTGEDRVAAQPHALRPPAWNHVVYVPLRCDDRHRRDADTGRRAWHRRARRAQGG